MERRTAKVNISSAGGTASKGARTCKVTLPTSWMDEMGIDMSQRTLELNFDGNSIILTRNRNGSEFAAQKLNKKHDVRLIRLYDGDELCTTIYADFTDKTVFSSNHTSDQVKTAFGNNALPVWNSFVAFLEERCVPRQRDGLREYLEVLGLDEYDPIEIIKKTAGRMAEDHQWVEIEDL